MKHSENSMETIGKKGFYVGIIAVTAVLVQVVIDLIYSGQL